MDFKGLTQTLESHRDESRAAQMSAYMRDYFPFFGIQANERRSIAKPYIRQLKLSKRIEWAEVFELFHQNEREYHYIACDYLNAVKNYAFAEDLSSLETVITTKSWWDTVDSLDGILMRIISHYPEVKPRIIEWSESDDIWLRRSAIICQRKKRKATDLDLLETVIKNNLERDEFFINKGIGWALREYSKTNEHWVSAFIENHEHKMSTLSIREASKYL